MKKLIAMLLALVMVLSMAACGNNNTPAATDPKNENTPRYYRSSRRHRGSC